MKYPYVVERILDHHPNLHPKAVAWRAWHCSFVSLEKRFMYFEVPKAACTQMKQLLRKLEGGQPANQFPKLGWESRREMFIHERANVPLPSLNDLDDSTQREVLESPDFFRMTIVRNPYSRLISAWRNRVLLCEPGEEKVYIHLKGNLPDLYDKSFVSFEEFVDYIGSACDLGTCDCHWRRQLDHIFYPALNFSYIAKLEKLNEGLRRFEEHLGLSSPLVFERRNASFPIGAASYTQELADRVYSLYRQDFEVLGYERDTWAATSKGASENSNSVPVETFLDEIIERNLVILHLHNEITRLRHQVHRVSRLRLLALANGLAACRSVARKVVCEIKRLGRRIFRPAEPGRQTGATSA